MTQILAKIRPYLLLLIGLTCSFFSFDGILAYYHICSSNKVVDRVTFRNQTWQLTSCEPRLANQDQYFYIDDVPINLPRLRYHLQPQNHEQAPALKLVGHTPTFYGNLSKFDYDRLRQQPQTSPPLGLQLSADMLAQPGPRNLEVVDGQLRVVFGNGKYLAFSTPQQAAAP